MQAKVNPLIRPKAMKLVERHLGENHLCAIVTSTNAFITAPIAREFGVDHLLATELEVRDGRFTGRPSGVPCFRQGKVTRLAEWLGERGQTLASFSSSWFYSDSPNPLPPPHPAPPPLPPAPPHTLPPPPL